MPASLPVRLRRAQVRAVTTNGFFHVYQGRRGNSTSAMMRFPTRVGNRIMRFRKLSDCSVGSASAVEGEETAVVTDHGHGQRVIVGGADEGIVTLPVTAHREGSGI